jgi:DNA gyrase subunit A
MFATANGNVRRNRLAEFIEVKANGKIAMKLDPYDRLIGVATCDESQDVVLATKGGKCIRFPVDNIRVFAGRDSTGVRGIRLASGDTVISLSLLAQMEPDADVREMYHKQSMARRAVETCKRGLVELDRRIAALETSTEEGAEKSLESALARRGCEQARLPDLELAAAELAPLLDQQTFMRLAEAEQFLLTVTENGHGKLSSSYRFRQSRRGGQGIASFDVSLRAASMAAVFEVASGDQVIMGTDAGKVLRIPLTRVPVRGRQTAGVRLFNVDDNERIVAVAHLREALLNTGEDDSDLDADLGDVAIADSDWGADDTTGAANRAPTGDQPGPAADGGGGSDSS